MALYSLLLDLPSESEGENLVHFNTVNIYRYKAIEAKGNTGDQQILQPIPGIALASIDNLPILVN